MHLAMILRQILMLVVFLAATYLAAALGALGSINAPGFYQQLQLPTLAPPAWLFGPVWTLLYTLMAVASWLVWRSAGAKARPLLVLYVLHLIVNASWSWCFFALQQGALALVNIVVLWLMIAALLFGYWRLQRLAALLLVPYLLWVSFALWLNLQLWQLNPSLL
ncbi:TspO/MBR family protein [Arsukibacterium sp.]|uniref:TspO/MBR family protein n=1 Tax=Arsukibacterium sp. TaxID=1977258 RepID=UPI002FDB89B9